MGVYIILWPYATLSCVLIAPIGLEGPVTSSYIESVCIVFAALFSSSSSTVALLFALFLSQPGRNDYHCGEHSYTDNQSSC